MEFAVILLPVVVAAAVLARWTRLHPLAVGALVGLPVGAIGLLVAGGAMSEVALKIGGISWLVGAAVGSVGAFAGWLRRKNVERTQ